MARWGHVPRTDVPVALLGGTSIFLWVLWRERPSRRLLLATSLFAGLAAAAKITWWLVLPAQALLIMAYPGAKLRARLRHAVVFSILPLILIAPWIARSQILTGTPVYPLTWRYTGGKYWTEAQDNWHEEWFRDWCTRKHPSLLTAPRGVPGHTYETLRSDWPQGAIVGLCLVALLFRRSVQGPVAPLVSGAAVAWLAVVGFLDGDPRHYLAAIAVGATVAGGVGAAVACGLGARAAGDVGASIQRGRLPKLGLTLVLLVAAASATASRSSEPFLVPEFLYGSDRGPMAIARTVRKKRPEGECQLWVNQRSPEDAVVFTTSKWSFYLRRQSIVLPLVLAEKVPLRQIPELLDEREVDYIVLDPTQDDESEPWWAGRWQEEHLRSTWELTRAARAAVTAEVVYGTEWVRAYEGQKGWYVYRRATPRDTHFPDAGED
jgi:hypothetical protein